MHQPTPMSRRRFLERTLGGAAAVGTLSGPAYASASARRDDAVPLLGTIPVERIGVQLFTVRDLLADDMLGLEGTLELLSDVGISSIELAGNYLGRTAGASRGLAERYGIRIAGNHFGPRAMDGENRWYSEAGRSQIFAEAKELGLEYVGTGHYYNVPLSVEGFEQFAINLNRWGSEASDAGLKFYFHNHDGEFTRFGDRPLFDILLEETDPTHVFFEVDLGWTAIAGEDVYELVRQHQRRFPLFHVKDFRFDDARGSRETKPNTLAAGRRFSFADVGKGQIDWPRLFSGLENPADHIYFIERDDAGNDRPLDDGSPPTNPAGSANTVWVSHKYLADLSF